MKPLVNRFKVGEEGIKQVLGDLEAEIMEVVWRLKEASVRDVLKEIQKKKEIAYTTVMTVMDRLHKKGLVDRNKDGQAFVYFAKVRKQEFKDNIIKKVLHSIINDSSELAMVHFVDELADDPKSLKVLQELIKTRMKSE